MNSYERKLRETIEEMVCNHVRDQVDVDVCDELTNSISELVAIESRKSFLNGLKARDKRRRNAKT